MESVGATMFACFQGLIHRRRRPNKAKRRSPVWKRRNKSSLRLITPEAALPVVPRWALSVARRCRVRRSRSSTADGIWRDDENATIDMVMSEDLSSSSSSSSCSSSGSSQNDDNCFSSPSSLVVCPEPEPQQKPQLQQLSLDLQLKDPVQPASELCSSSDSLPAEPRNEIPKEDETKEDDILLDLDYYQTENQSCASTPWMSDDYYWMGFLSAKSLPGSTPSLPQQERRRVQFKPDHLVVSHVFEIPSHREFSMEEKMHIWTDTQTIYWCAKRNSKEWRYEGRNWQTVLEEDKFLADCHGNLIHPVHWETNCV